MPNPTATPAPRPAWRLWCGASILAACETDWLYGARPGLNWALSGLAVALGLLLCRRRAMKDAPAEVAAALGLAVLLAAAAAVTADPANERLIAAGTLFALGTAVSADSLRQAADAGALGWLLAAPGAAWLAAAEAGRRFGEAVTWLRAGRSIPALRGVAFAAPLTVLLALLLSEADPTFAAWRELARALLRDSATVPRAIFWAVLTGCLLGAFGTALRAAAPARAAPARRETPQLFGDTERLIILGSVAALFGLFLVLQVSYLFGDPGGRSGSGVSYAQAVHRGFVELNVAASVCGAVLLLLGRYARPGPRLPRVMVLEWLVTVQAQILLTSAFYRLMLYEQAYGFTRLRLYVQVYAVLAFIALLLLALELPRAPQPARLLRRAAATAGLAACVLMYGNSDAWIARANLLRYARTGRIDVPYLTVGLGPDAVPLLVRELAQLPASVATSLAAQLRERYRGRGTGGTRWVEWNLRRAALERALARLDHDPHFAAGPDLNTAPSFITNATFFSTFTSASGSPSTAIRSAYAPGAMTPSWPRRPSSSAARTVAD
jgi:uncharacterized protein DUF4153